MTILLESNGKQTPVDLGRAIFTCNAHPDRDGNIIRGVVIPGCSVLPRDIGDAMDVSFSRHEVPVSELSDSERKAVMSAFDQKAAWNVWYGGARYGNDPFAAPFLNTYNDMIAKYMTDDRLPIMVGEWVPRRMAYRGGRRFEVGGYRAPLAVMPGAILARASRTVCYTPYGKTDFNSKIRNCVLEMEKMIRATAGRTGTEEDL